MNAIITSKDNSSIKYAKKIMSSAKFRNQENIFAIEGIRLCDDACKSGVNIQTVFYTQKCYGKFPEIIDGIIANSQKNFIVSEEIISLISDTDTPQGVVCMCGKINNEFKSNLENIEKLVLLENIQNPSNLGNILRTCDALGLKTVAISKSSCDVYNPKVLRGAMGAIFRLCVIDFESTLEFINKLKKIGFKVYATVPGENAIRIVDVDFSKKICLAMGNEGNGLETETLKASDEKITIPMAKGAESLNVSVAAGIAVWEMLKRGN